ncbi:esterase lipase [Colletotrichum incanum]|uniref:Esterase lipase n=1 Tax=Colletotrichum incanum TaxID=1573173 RepID=A0A166QFF8_COLIC|nr:esterase lipase [Colletotrichum incanum]OHW95208.1 esterase/lipase domain-containing protein [Colletotrichum incanum]
MASFTPFSVTVHHLGAEIPNLIAYERGVSASKNALVFIGGLTEGPHTNAAIGVIAQRLEGTDFGVWELRMRSSYTGFGYSTLSNDVEDISVLVRYLRKISKEKIVLLGASTGCQDCLEYTDHEKYRNVPVDGYILLSPVSERQAAGLIMSQEDYVRSIKHAQDMILQGNESEAMPTSLIPFVFSSPVTAYRWNSLAAQGGDDDYFSSDLDDATVKRKFGRIDRPILFLPGEKDELVLPSVDKRELLERWCQACPVDTISGLSGNIPGADHAVSQPEAREWVGTTVRSFVELL